MNTRIPGAQLDVQIQALQARAACEGESGRGQEGLEGCWGGIAAQMQENAGALQRRQAQEQERQPVEVLVGRRQLTCALHRSALHAEPPPGVHARLGACGGRGVGRDAGTRRDPLC